MSPLTTHVLDTRTGKPAAGIVARLEMAEGAGWKWVAAGVTNTDGRIADMLKPGSLEIGRHRLTFDTGAYFTAQGVEHFYPQVTIEFEIAAAEQHYHVPLLLAPFGYSTYRGS